MQNMNTLFKILGFLLATPLAWAQPAEQGLFWKIEGGGLTQASYLFGTIHLIPAADYFLPEGVEKALSKTNKVYMEVDLDDMQDMSIMLGVMDKIMMHGDTSLSDLVSKEDYQKLQDYFNKIGLPLGLFERMKPMFLSAMVGTEGNPQALQDGSFKSYEMELASMAKAHQKEVDGLESMEFQLSIFDQIPYSIQAQMLMESIHSADSSQSTSEVLFELYKSQDLDALTKAVAQEDKQLQPYLEMMLYNRNQNWIPVMRSAMQSGSCFFAVGAGHLGGDRGVIQLLRNEGYEVKRMK